MNVRLTQQQMDLLIEVRTYFKWLPIIDFEEHPTCIVIKELNEDDAVALRELCSDYLLEVGMNEDYTVNTKGKLLEELVDKLYV